MGEHGKDRGMRADERKIANIQDLEPGQQASLADLYDSYTTYSSMETEAKQGKKQAASGLLLLLEGMGLDGVDVVDRRLAKSSNRSSRIVRDRLLERGVSPDIIAYATVETESEPFLRVSKLGGVDGS